MRFSWITLFGIALLLCTSVAFACEEHDDVPVLDQHGSTTPGSTTPQESTTSGDSTTVPADTTTPESTPPAESTTPKGSNDEPQPGPCSDKLGALKPDWQLLKQEIENIQNIVDSLNDQSQCADSLKRIGPHWSSVENIVSRLQGLIQTMKCDAVQYEMQTLTITENSSDDIKCGEGEKINILSAQYGPQVENETKLNPEGCKYQDVDLLSCNGKQACNVSSNNGKGDPCPGYYKKTVIQFECRKTCGTDVQR